ncbi:conserved hypothetical protein, steroid delta-isomerase-related [Raineyella antarctica]|uniref:SnoaL-like domain-containing protein n=1 Tax=Raineyella antarctica TaxID=1577474 RepID=A0A1G6GQ01_9ACTN|nr:nuclear transport factor 2 family protein [Raineyella antarctica]SDB83893.1 conserved hypothetical protein, steroid delta-isomerase-related [Raineyella antarctica]
MTDITTTPPSTGSSEDLVEAYFRAWNGHDPSALVAVFSEEGTYQDPSLPEPVTGDAIAGYAAALLGVFPDLAFSVDETTAEADRTVVAWHMTGTNTGPFPGLGGPTGASVDLPGIDVITVGPGGVTSVVGYFDQLGLLGQLRVPVQIGGA